MVNQDQWNKKALDYIYEQREKAFFCTICGKKLFSHYQSTDDFIWKNYGKLMDLPEVQKGIYSFVMEKYTLSMYDGGLERHHTNYKKGITIPVCSSCHRRIHTTKDPKYTEYLPVDERPKNTSKIVYNIYDTGKMFNL